MKKLVSINFSTIAKFFLILNLSLLQIACSSVFLIKEGLKKFNSENTDSKKNYKPKYAGKFDLNSQTGIVNKEVYDLLLKKDFSSIEKLADQARVNKERLIGGYWKIDSIYEALSSLFSEQSDQEITDELWKNRIELLKSYKNEYPDSITARVALASTYINYGWFARGFGYIDAVSNSDLELLRERLSLAEKELIEAKSLEIRCPRWFREALFLGMATGMSKSEFNELFEEAIEFEPNYLNFYLVKSEYLMPRWGGKTGDWEEYMNTLPNELTKLKTDEIDIIFFVVAVNKLKEPDNLNAIMASRQRIYKGLNDLEKKYKLDIKRLNQAAYISYVTSNFEGAKWAFNQIGDKWDKDVWGKKDTFDVIKQSLFQSNANLIQK